MLYKYAKKLHIQDEVALKETGEIITVLNIEAHDKNVFIYAMTNDGYTKLNHKKIK